MNHNHEYEYEPKNDSYHIRYSYSTSAYHIDSNNCIRKHKFEKSNELFECSTSGK